MRNTWNKHDRLLLFEARCNRPLGNFSHAKEVQNIAQQRYAMQHAAEMSKFRYANRFHNLVRSVNW
jgi:hypothetical protein